MPVGRTKSSNSSADELGTFILDHVVSRQVDLGHRFADLPVDDRAACIEDSAQVVERTREVDVDVPVFVGPQRLNEAGAPSSWASCPLVEEFRAGQHAVHARRARCCYSRWSRSDERMSIRSAGTTGGSGYSQRWRE